ncbi:MAG: hypothetical protein OI860_00695 (plasmid) [Candidatus Methanoperedens sp.]|uniref:hypothetical protein n=1 Tax=Candidatus Methanoperedens sp. BLZ2 TaxID=2035255 RepID=UPI000BE23CA8|nr:hypothetical protein [Candidatus Methanoperedens sp. BLZ2]KAB2945257.1 MAG: hypothetical protein F9K14_11525 [Candidatus Methanoperedens sp.]MBZ0175600.1 hypothetical protein [Candidatus Methanoperedens nitroreducens]WAH95127.1 MAG: hypothetical protein OI863_00620 [Candidatus Methanoperedens sp.]WAM22313.1 MAG: hypothetical protein OI860_00695 [Candidatus Methanoperedens sp.]
MEHDLTDRIPFRIESKRGDDTLGTNTKTGTVLTDFEATEKGVPFQSGVPRDKILEAIEKALKQEKWVCVEKKDGTTELLTQKDIPKVQDENAIEPAVMVNSGNREDTSQPPKKEWEGDLKPMQVSTKKPGVTNQTIDPVHAKQKEEWVSKFANIKSATATHKGKGG